LSRHVAVFQETYMAAEVWYGEDMEIRGAGGRRLTSRLRQEGERREVGEQASAAQRRRRRVPKR